MGWLIEPSASTDRLCSERNDMTAVNISLLAVGGFILVLGVLSRPEKRNPLSEPFLALLFGVVLGPAVLGWLDPMSWGDEQVILEQVAQLTLAIGLMSVALRLPGHVFRQQRRSMTVLLGLVMPLMWLTSGFIMYALLDVPFWVALLIGGIVTPTDPIVSTTIVTGTLAEQHLPDRLRHALSAESGANDGLAYPFVLLPILLHELPVQDAMTHWLTHTVLLEIGGAAVLAALVGYAAGRMLRWAKSRQLVTESSLLAFTLAMSLAVLGGINLLGMNGIFAVFVAGIAFDISSTGEQQREYEIQEAVNRFFVLPIFMLLGLILPWQEWMELGWRGLAVAGLVIALRRLPAMVLIRSILPVTQSRRDNLFLGWFGPIGVAALFYASHAWSRTGLEIVWVVGSLVVCLSVVLHGVTAAPLTVLYGRTVRRDLVEARSE